jgi:hypothetical protein
MRNVFINPGDVSFQVAVIALCGNRDLYAVTALQGTNLYLHIVCLTGLRHQSRFFVINFPSDTPQTRSLAT